MSDREAFFAALGELLLRSVAVSRQLGHSSVRETMRTYVHPTDPVGLLLRDILVSDDANGLAERWPFFAEIQKEMNTNLGSLLRAERMSRMYDASALTNGPGGAMNTPGPGQTYEEVQRG